MNSKKVVALVWLSCFAVQHLLADSGNLQGPSNPPPMNSVIRGRDEALRELNAERRREGYQPDPEGASPSASPGAPTFSGAFAFGGSGTVEIVGSASDAQGNSVVAGGFQGSVNFPGGPKLTSSADFDVFVAKFTPAGQTIWVRQARAAVGLQSGFSLDGALAVAIDASGNVYVGGGFVQSLIFVNGDGGPLVRLTSNGNAVNFEAFLAKYDSGGNLVWARGGAGGGTAPTHGLAGDINGVDALTVDSKGNLFAGGTARGSSFLGRAFDAPVSSTAVLAAIDPATGSVIWLNSLSASSGDNGVVAIASDSAGGVYGLGYAEASIAFTTASGQISLTGFSDSNAWWIARWDGSGNALWAKRPGQGALYFDGIAASSQGLVYIAGDVESAATIGGFTIAAPADFESVLVQYDSSGNPQWVRTFSSSGASYARDVAVDPSGNAYVTGEFFGSTSMGNSVSLTSEGHDDEFLGKYDRSGAPQWIRSLNSAGHDGAGYKGSADIPIAVNSSKVIYNVALNSIQLTSDFTGAAQLDSFTATAEGTNRFALVARIPSAGASIAGVVNAASYAVGTVTPNSYAAIFGSNLAASVGDAATFVSLTDAAGKQFNLTLILVSPGQVNFLVPGGVAVGAGTLRVTTGALQSATIPVSVATFAPGLFSANGNGQGAAAAQALVVAADGSFSFLPVAQCDASGCTTVTVPLAAGTRVYLVLYGTGVRGAKNVTVSIGGVQGMVLYAGAQGGYPGLDQINVLTPASLAGRGEVDIILTGDGAVSNAVRARF